MARGSMLGRMKGAAFLDVATYEAVEHDASATGQAAGVVLLVAAAHAVGAWEAGPVSIVGAGFAALVAWLVWAAITWVVGTRLLSGTATWGELLRTLGFAQAPGVLAALAILPLVDWPLAFVVALWTLAAGIVAVRQALDFSTGKAVATVVLGWIALAVLRAVF